MRAKRLFTDYNRLFYGYDDRRSVTLIGVNRTERFVGGAPFVACKLAAGSRPRHRRSIRRFSVRRRAPGRAGLGGLASADWPCQQARTVAGCGRSRVAPGASVAHAAEGRSFEGGSRSSKHGDGRRARRGRECVRSLHRGARSRIRRCRRPPREGSLCLVRLAMFFRSTARSLSKERRCAPAPSKR